MATKAAVGIAEKMCDGLYKPDDSMARPEDYYNLIDAELCAEREAAKKMQEALAKARLQIQYLHAKFKETGSGNQVLAQLDNALAAYEKAKGGG